MHVNGQLSGTRRRWKQNLKVLSGGLIVHPVVHNIISNTVRRLGLVAPGVLGVVHDPHMFLHAAGNDRGEGTEVASASRVLVHFPDVLSHGFLRDEQLAALRARNVPQILMHFNMILVPAFSCP